MDNDESDVHSIGIERCLATAFGEENGDHNKCGEVKEGIHSIE
jgi:hypothetical protein